MKGKEYVDWFNKKFAQSFSTIEHNPTFWEVDQMICVGLIESFNIKSLLEFGTHEGRSALFFWLHPNIERIKTVDWGWPFPKERYGSFFRKYDEQKFGRMMPEQVELVFSKITEWKPKEDEQYDMIFIDAGHEYENVKHDSELAYSMKPKLIMWHDYPNEPGVKKYIDEVKEEKNIQTFGRIAWMEIKNE